MISIFSSADDRVERIPLDRLRDLLADGPNSRRVLWVDLNEPTEQEEELILRDVFKFHPLAIEDCQRERLSPKHGDHLPKVEDYGGYLFSIINPIEAVEADFDVPGEPTFEVDTHQINVFLGESYLVTHHYEPSPAIDETIVSCDKNPHLLARGPDYVYHLILDGIVDRYSPILDMFDEEIDRLEEIVFKKSTPETLPKILAMKRGVFRLRRITTYQREMVYRLSRGEFALIAEGEVAYYRNVFDHLVRAADLTESYRDVLTGMLDAYLSVTSNRLNEVMKVLTIISTFFLPLSFVAGVYGMNFENMPELHWKYGYAVAWGVMLSVAAVMFIFFRRKKWL
jgi:magnesium transporter